MTKSKKTKKNVKEIQKKGKVKSGSVDPEEALAKADDLSDEDLDEIAGGKGAPVALYGDFWKPGDPKDDDPADPIIQH
jgi:hypothetical protein